MVFSVYKKVGEGLNELLSRVRAQRGFSEEEPITYAGRLDPLAEGVVLILSGEDRFEKDKYLNLDKEYEVTILFGIETDTLDLMGIVKKVYDKKIQNDEIENAIISIQENTKWRYPKFSSKTFDGKPLFVWTRNNLHTPDIYKEGKVKEICVIEKSVISRERLIAVVNENVSLVNGDFRQEEVLASWQKALGDSSVNNFEQIKIKVVVTSGIYMREIARLLGENLGTCAIASHIKRTRVGGFFNDILL